MKKLWDKWGIALSSVCILHCFAVVFIPLLLPALNLVTHSPWFHRIFAVLIIFTTPLAFIPGYRRHGLHRVLAFALIGVSLILLGVFLDGSVEEWLSHGISIVGSVLLVSAHIFNLRHAQKHKHCC